MLLMMMRSGAMSLVRDTSPSRCCSVHVVALDASSLFIALRGERLARVMVDTLVVGICRIKVSSAHGQQLDRAAPYNRPPHPHPTPHTHYSPYGMGGGSPNHLELYTML
jgi:hypothetical protein